METCLRNTILEQKSKERYPKEKCLDSGNNKDEQDFVQRYAKKSAIRNNYCNLKLLFEGISNDNCASVSVICVQELSGYRGVVLMVI